jgi:hypothetical protein
MSKVKKSRGLKMKVNDLEIIHAIEQYLLENGIYDITLEKVQKHLLKVMNNEKAPCLSTIATILKDTFHLKFKK